MDDLAVARTHSRTDRILLLEDEDTPGIPAQLPGDCQSDGPCPYDDCTDPFQAQAPKLIAQ
jgi:hypothetical protein